MNSATLSGKTKKKKYNYDGRSIALCSLLIFLFSSFALAENSLSCSSRLQKPAKDYIMSESEKSARDQLMLAAQNGNKNLVGEYLSSGGDANLHVFLGASLLTHAICGGQIDIVRILLEEGADPELPGELYPGVNGCTPLRVVKMLRKDKKLDEQTAREIEQLLTEAIKKKTARTSVDEMLIKAIDAKDTALAQNAIQQGADVNKPSAEGDSPVDLAVKRGEVEIVRALFDADASCNVGLYKRLRDNKTDGLTDSERQGLIALFEARMNAEATEYIKTCFREGIIGTEKLGKHVLGYRCIDDNSGGVPPFLISAAAAGNYELCQFLLEVGANPMVKDIQGRTALDMVNSDAYCGSDDAKTKIIDLLNAHIEKNSAKKQ